jgi:hypothetical protein|tara:strand:+ start:914 stop:1060 length:147 start_codon:yes stop_codon:yes gene_type:complete
MGRLRDLINGGVSAPPAPEVKSTPKATAPKKSAKKSEARSTDADNTSE